MISRWTLQAALLQVPSLKLNPFEHRVRRVRLLATTMVRDEREYLPGMLGSVGPQVDGIVALDDGSSDGTDQLLEQSPYVIKVMRNPPSRALWDEPAGHRQLVAAALRLQADWIISVDADERLERDFRWRAERVIRRGNRLGLSAFVVHLRELWDYLQLDPDARWQPGIGYAYLTDERGLRLRGIPAGRGYQE